MGFTYTRYADDLTFSSAEEHATHIGRILRQVEYVVKAEGFQLHRKRRESFVKAVAKEVTGLVVNEKVNIPRKNSGSFERRYSRLKKMVRMENGGGIHLMSWKPFGATPTLSPWLILRRDKNISSAFRRFLKKQVEDGRIIHNGKGGLQRRLQKM
ncbi:MAG: hypothetical protein R3C11_12760 [Planctomycetaceae bacterium]